MLTLRYRYASLINPHICANCGETDAPKKETHWGYVCSECRRKCSECQDWMLGESVTIAGKEFCKDCAAEIDALADRLITVPDCAFCGEPASTSMGGYEMGGDYDESRWAEYDICEKCARKAERRTA